MNPSQPFPFGSMTRACLGLALLLLAGCSSMPSLKMPSLSPTSTPLLPDLAANPAAGRIIHPRRPITLDLKPYLDARSAAGSEKIGDIRSTVNDMLGTELKLQNVAGTVTTAMRNQLAASGYQLRTEGDKGGAPTDFEIGGAVKEFSLDIAGRDAVAIVVETTLRDPRGSVLWSGSVAEKADRFAGVSGNSRASITRYLSAALAKLTGKTRDALSETILQTHPQWFYQAAPARQSTPGVTEFVAPPDPARSAMREDVATGRLVIATTPARAKVYVGDVYYGLSPLVLELEAGIHALHFKLDDHKATSEKVSVRKGETTELEIQFAH